LKRGLEAHKSWGWVGATGGGGVCPININWELETQLDDREYEVESILESRGSGLATELLVVWKGFDVERATWEQWVALRDLEVVRTYMDKQKADGDGGENAEVAKVETVPPTSKQGQTCVAKDKLASSNKRKGKAKNCQPPASEDKGKCDEHEEKTKTKKARISSHTGDAGALTKSPPKTPNAPGKKLAAKGIKKESPQAGLPPAVGEVVWGRSKGYQWWPGVLEKAGGSSFTVSYLGAQGTYDIVPRGSLRPWRHPEAQVMERAGLRAADQGAQDYQGFGAAFIEADARWICENKTTAKPSS